MIPHKLYFVDEKLLLISEKDATLYILKGHTVFDLYESLDMEPEYYGEKHEYIYTN